MCFYFKFMELENNLKTYCRTLFGRHPPLIPSNRKNSTSTQRKRNSRTADEEIFSSYADNPPSMFIEVFEGEQVMTMVFSFSRGWICTPVSRLKIIYSNIFIELESYLNTYCSRCRKKCKNKYFGIDWKLIPMWHKQEKLFSSFKMAFNALRLKIVKMSQQSIVTSDTIQPIGDGSRKF